MDGPLTKFHVECHFDAVLARDFVVGALCVASKIDASFSRQMLEMDFAAEFAFNCVLIVIVRLERCKFRKPVADYLIARIEITRGKHFASRVGETPRSGLALRQ